MGTRLGESPGNEAGGEPRERGWGRAPGIRLEERSGIKLGERPGNEAGRRPRNEAGGKAWE